MPNEFKSYETAGIDRGVCRVSLWFAFGKHEIETHSLCTSDIDMHTSISADTKYA